MTLDEAIENLRKELTLRLGGNSLKLAMQYGNKRVAPIQLGIEALERLEVVRDILDTNLVKSLLPSETE